ncbi:MULTISPECIES: F0F1 ATP synthase subunit delta [unclassified Campylobacter]|uniref:F0F1 ATP synthase subunit delta n=1 Tax=unclassified Campylobacter TaxID=2593542 RepID=UPI0012381618|nr:MULTISPECIES: F0F1 ATP synthase subunit delta [unclassified Campylobacter]KAA6227320.1 F0F1 ATP synthase subunit delta [Campylobacter sp. LR286c]KAA6227805.1 F0F1 ATP synthase subunit delta [Campylobacter sp. LR185c]KAA6228213.1 F0F1 ATP synthase subunit delta [Campylobacter sp. LR196d]KAA6229213.1 F0F1 ATP synthase subunit delta [Campylobacter sp. LR291e]KAA6231018.1 F0F1 ATP synthase subunit delta [Campylobacter sp. LR264d]
MNDIIAKRYARAVSKQDINEIYETLSGLVPAFSLPKFKIIVESTQVKKKKKAELLFSFFENLSLNCKNFLNLLVENSRISYIPQIVKELERQKITEENIYIGLVYTKEVLAQEKLEELQAKLSQKFKVKIQLQNQLINIDGVKIVLEELGYEISFSMKTLQNRISEFILKTI